MRIKIPFTKFVLVIRVANKASTGSQVPEDTITICIEREAE